MHSNTRRSHSRGAVALCGLVMGTAACGGPQTRTAPMAVNTTVAADAGSSVSTTQDAAPAVDPRAQALLDAVSRMDKDAGVVVKAGPETIAGPDGANWATGIVIQNDRTAWVVVTSVPAADGTSATELFENAATGPAAFQVRDVTGDGAAEIVALRNTAEEYSGQRISMYRPRVTEGGLEVNELVFLPTALLGESDLSTLDSALAHAKEFEAPKDNMILPRFLVRLPFASLEQFRSIVAPAGLKICSDLPDRSGRRRKSCKPPLRPAQITQQIFTRDVLPRVSGYGEFATPNGDALLAPTCSTENGKTSCSANVGGPIGIALQFTGSGASLKLVEISNWAESS